MPLLPTPSATVAAAAVAAAAVSGCCCCVVATFFGSYLLCICSGHSSNIPRHSSNILTQWRRRLHSLPAIKYATDDHLSTTATATAAATATATATAAAPQQLLNFTEL